MSFTLAASQNSCIEEICFCGYNSRLHPIQEHIRNRGCDSIFVEYKPTYSLDVSFDHNLCPCGGFDICESINTHFRPISTPQAELELLQCEVSPFCACGYYYCGPNPDSFECGCYIHVQNNQPRSR